MRATSKLAYIHCLVHAESYAIDLMWDLIARFHDPSLPKEFYDDWIQVTCAHERESERERERERERESMLRLLETLKLVERERGRRDSESARAADEEVA